MSESFEIASSEGRYKVELGLGLLAKTLGGLKNAVVLCDSRLADRLPFDASAVIRVEATEQTKDLASLSPVMVQLKERGANRNTLLYAIGGGVVQDVACFTASVYMRGMKWIYFPTTLLGMADSCIGGKSSINAGGFKNLVGTFHPPEAVHIDVELASTLGAEQKVAGLAEAVKICFAHTGDAFERYLALDPAPDMQPAGLMQIIGLSLKTKKWFIETDEFDRNERQLLNFGHTFGHAIEAATDYAVSHGVAVAVGMLAALEYGKKRGYNADGVRRTEALARHTRALLARVPELPAQLATLDTARAVDKFTADKKHDADHYWIIAPGAAGYLERVSLPKTDASRKDILALFTYAQGLK